MFRTRLGRRNKLLPILIVFVTPPPKKKKKKSHIQISDYVATNEVLHTYTIKYDKIPIIMIAELPPHSPDTNLYCEPLPPPPRAVQFSYKN